MNTVKKIGAVFLFVLVVLMFVFLDHLVQEEEKQDPTGEISPMEKDQYNGYGLPQGQALEQNPFYQDDEVVIYEDRVCRHFRQNEENINHTITIAQNISAQIPTNTNFFVLPVPPRIVLEEGYKEDAEQYQLYLETLESRLPAQAELIDTLPVLEEHSGEYIFYRTEDAWTAKGAYYGAKTLCEHMGITPIALDQYDEYMFKLFMGSLCQDTADLFEEHSENYIRTHDMTNDPIYYYRLPDSENIAEVHWQESQDEIVEKRPLIRKSGTGTSVFVGEEFEWAIVDGDKKSENKQDSSLLLLCDGTGKILTPYLANYYKNIYVINIWEYEDLESQLENIIDTYSITDVVYAQNAEEMGSRQDSKAFLSMLNTQNIN